MPQSLLHVERAFNVFYIAHAIDTKNDTWIKSGDKLEVKKTRKEILVPVIFQQKI